MPVNKITGQCRPINLIPRGAGRRILMVQFLISLVVSIKKRMRRGKRRTTTSVNEVMRFKVEAELKKRLDRGERIRPIWQARTWIEYQLGWYTTPVKGQEDVYAANRAQPLASLLAWQRGFRLSKATLSDRLIVERWKEWGHGMHWDKDESFGAETHTELVEEMNQREKMHKERRRTENDKILRSLRRS